jgi:LmbE family N-acetylglucosaminyl deacetylase
MLRLRPERLGELVLLGAHCDDIAIGAGGTLLELCREYPGLRVTALVLSGAGTPREAEERAALATLCPGADLLVSVLGLTDSRLPNHWREVKEALSGLRGATEPDLVLAPAPHDAHQDHRLLAELVPTAFRDHLTLGYEILKWEGDLVQPGVYLPLAETSLRAKVAALTTHYASQRTRPWFDVEAFTGLARIRGVQCQTRYAEAFHLDKLVIGAGPVGTSRDTTAARPTALGAGRN